MKIKLSDYVAQFLSDNGIEQVFMIVGGGAMHLDDSLGRNDKLKLMFNHHEQACAIAAESYARMENRMACVCVTTGPGGTNAMTGVVGAYLDSIPMIVISGQVRYDTTARSTGLPLRAVGDQEFDITTALQTMTKYAEMVTNPMHIRKALEKAFYLAKAGRPGPCWLDIPLNVQAAVIETKDLEPYNPEADNAAMPPAVSEDTVGTVLQHIRNAKRPVFYAGNGIRISGSNELFRRIAKKLNIPVVTCWDSIDEIEDSDPLYTGRGGMMGDRAGNFAVQNSDLILAVGNRLSIRQVGYTWEKWAPNAFVIDVDVDRFELKKPTIHVEMPIWADAHDFLSKMDNMLPDGEKLYSSQKVYFMGEMCVKHVGDVRPDNWLDLCRFWKEEYPVVEPKHFKDVNQTNVYAFMGKLSRFLPEGQTIVVGNGSACVVGSHGFYIKKGQRFIINSAIASMGYDLPAAIGAAASIGAVTANDIVSDSSDDRNVVLITGDGSLQMNIQELQTIVTNRLNIKIFVINNDGYHSIRQTQTNLFDKHFVGIGPESKDLSFPELKKLAAAYGYPYYECRDNSQIDKALTDTMTTKGYAICEVFCSSEQFFEPKSATKKLPDGTLVSPPLEDLGPFLPKEELAANMVRP